MQIGVIIETGPMDWQIIQQVDGRSDISLSGNWVPDEQVGKTKIYVRIVREDTGSVVIPWQESEELDSFKWQVLIKNVPAGGLYRIETCLKPKDNKGIQWGIRGDMIHHVGIGDVYVIAGQSNSAGYGKDPIFDPPEIGIHLLKNNGRWDLATHPMNESTNTIHEENTEIANPGHSPYLSFARQLKKELGYPIGLIQSSLGGSPLRAWNPEEDGILYGSMMNSIRSQGNRIKGVLWYQGCSDAVEGLCNTYLDRFKSMVSHIRKDLNEAHLPILTVQLNRYVASTNEKENQYWGKIREAQRLACKKIDNVFVIPSTDSRLSDVIHNNSSSNMVLGERLAGVALKNIYGRNFYAEAPDLIEARKGDGNKVLLKFNNVLDRLYAFEVGAGELPFSIEDENGFVEITRYEINDAGNIIIITLDKELKGPCQVHGAFEPNPKYLIPMDLATHLPILSFYGVKILGSDEF